MDEAGSESRIRLAAEWDIELLEQAAEGHILMEEAVYAHDEGFGLELLDHNPDPAPEEICDDGVCKTNGTLSSLPRRLQIGRHAIGIRIA
ncbi:hypothetical protein [Paenibacillus sp. YAF4_2]|uniref:hypothetical protein n=1 Tax=Paenibacillus sp. YAF4_2 TaxID=3233085 RepID=UPI003F9C8DE9